MMSEFEKMQWAPTWMKIFAELEAYKKVHGNCNVPHYYNNHKLTTWVRTQSRSSTSHSNESLRKLNTIRLVFDPIKVKWMTKFDELKDYKKVQ